MKLKKKGEREHFVPSSALAVNFPFRRALFLYVLRWKTSLV